MLYMSRDYTLFPQNLAVPRYPAVATSLFFNQDSFTCRRTSNIGNLRMRAQQQLSGLHPVGGGGIIHPTPPPPIKLLNTIINCFAKLLRRLLKTRPKVILNSYAHSLVTFPLPQDLLLNVTLVIV